MTVPLIEKLFNDPTSDINTTVSDTSFNNTTTTPIDVNVGSTSGWPSGYFFRVRASDAASGSGYDTNVELARAYVSSAGVLTIDQRGIETSAVAHGSGTYIELADTAAGNEAARGPTLIADGGNASTVYDPSIVKIISISGPTFSYLASGTTDTSSMVISNAGGADLEVATITYPDGYSGDWDGGIVPAGGSQTVTVTFAPVSAIDYAGTIRVSCDSTYGNPTTSVSGTASTGTKIIGLSLPDFGYVAPTTTSTQTLRISNTGSSTLAVSGITWPTGYSDAESFPFNISAGAHHDVTVTFAPASGIAYNGTATVASDKTAGTNTIAVTGTGASITKIISITPSPYDFGNVAVNTHPSRLFKIENSGNGTLTVTGITFSGTAFYTTTNRFFNKYGVLVGSSMAIVSGDYGYGGIIFYPRTTGSFSETATFVSDKTSGTNTVTVTGTGT